MQTLNSYSPPYTVNLHNHRSHYNLIAVIPAFNEERFIGSVVLTAREYATTVIVIDDGSTDGTGRIAAAAGALVIRHDQNRGKGIALNSGFREALKLEPDVVITIDADGQHTPGELDIVAAPILQGKADIVVGSRYLGNKTYVPQHRVWGHHLFNFVTNLFSGITVTDSQSGFRAFSPRAVRTVSFQSDGFSVESEMQFIAREQKLTLLEAPITISYLDKPKRSVIAHGLQVLNGLLQLVGQYRPLLFFGLPGIFLFLVALGLGSWVVHLYRTSNQFPAGYMLISLVLLLSGSAILSIGIILHSVRGLLLQHRFLSEENVNQGSHGL